MRIIVLTNGKSSVKNEEPDTDNYIRRPAPSKRQKQQSTVSNQKSTQDPNSFSGNSARKSSQQSITKKNN